MHAFDKAAAERPYMFVGALEALDPGRRLSALALSSAVSDTDAVTASEALVGWALPAAEHAALERATVEAVSAAAYAHHRGSARAFRAAVTRETWDLWLDMALAAENEGVAEEMLAARRRGVERDTRRVLLQCALYFAGLECDAAGENTTAFLMRDHRMRHVRALAFLDSGPSVTDRMRAEAAAVAEAIAGEAALAKRKRHREDDPGRKGRRAALRCALLDAGAGAPSEMTDEEAAFVDAGPRRLADMLEAADTIARKRGAGPSAPA